MLTVLALRLHVTHAIPCDITLKSCASLSWVEAVRKYVMLLHDFVTSERHEWSRSLGCHALPCLALHARRTPDAMAGPLKCISTVNDTFRHIQCNMAQQYRACKARGCRAAVDANYGGNRKRSTALGDLLKQQLAEVFMIIGWFLYRSSLL